jgi:hypothetical protein
VSGGADEILRKREALIEQCELQRVDIAVHVGGLHTPIAIADRGLGVVRFLRGHPMVLGAAVAAITAMRGRGLWIRKQREMVPRSGLLKWGQRGLVAWRAWRAWRGHRSPV